MEDSVETIEKEYNKIHLYFSYVLVGAGAALGVGTVFFHFVEHLKWLDSVYFCTITLTTIGYGDITPKTDAGKIFDIFYVLVGIGILATFANLFIKNAGLKRQLKNAKSRAAKRATSHTT